VPHIALQGAANVRDLGGTVTSSGRKVLPGKVFRGDSLSTLTNADVDVLAGLGLHTVIDFRSLPEVSHAGSDRLPPGAQGVELPINAGDVQGFAAIMGDPGKQRDMLGDGKAEEFMKRANRSFVSDDAHREQFSRALHLIGAGQPVLYHCTAGKDRTGWMTAILLTALGVPRDTVMDDYLATNEYVWPSYEVQMQPLVETGKLDMPVFKPLLVQDPGYLDAAFGEVEARYGTFGEFLRRGLDFGKDDVERLRSALLG
jgi:protein-tyrosine phosphatase